MRVDYFICFPCVCTIFNVRLKDYSDIIESLSFSISVAMRHTITACIVTVVKNVSALFHQLTCWRFTF